jgi:glycosyltransferase involved in cell wall biosynthesis
LSGKKKVVLIITKMSQGGAIVVAVDIARGLRARGHDVETWFLYSQDLAYVDEPGAKLILPRPVRSPLDYLRIFAALVSRLRQAKPDAVHGVLPLGNVLGLCAAWLAGCPVRVASQHSVVRVYHPVMRLLDRAMGSLGIYTANVIVSRAMAADFSGYSRGYRDRLRVIENGVPYRAPRFGKAAARREMGLPAGDFLLGHLGRLTHAKNQEFLFELLGRLPGVHLALAGDGENRRWYETLIAEQGLGDRVHLLGGIPPDSVPDFLASLDLFVMPSRFEGLPIALIEAHQAALPCIVSDIPANREVVQTGKDISAILLPTDRPDTWVKTVQELQDDPPRRAALAARAKERANFFGFDRMLKAYEDCFFDDATGNVGGP